VNRDKKIEKLYFIYTTVVMIFYKEINFPEKIISQSDPSGAVLCVLCSTCLDLKQLLASAPKHTKKTSGQNFPGTEHTEGGRIISTMQ
jgi:hypothetical protein